MADKDSLKCNTPQRTPGHPKSSHVVKACTTGKEKLVRFGQQGVSGSPKKEGESESYRKRRKSFKSRHAKNIAKGPSSAAYWANKVKWAEGGVVDAAPRVPGGSEDKSEEAKAWLLSRLAASAKEAFGERPVGLSPELKQQLETPGLVGLFNKYVVSPSVAAGDAALRAVPAVFAGAGTAAGAAYDELAPKLPDVVRRNLGTGDQLARDITALPDVLIPELRVFAPAAQSARASATYGATKVADDVAAASARRAINRAAAQVPDDSAYDALRQRYEDAGAMQRAVLPQGNINLQPGISAETLRGPDVQPLESFLAQVRGEPGVNRDALEELSRRYEDMPAGSMISKSEFAARIPPSQYNTVDLKNLAAHSDYDRALYVEQATDYLYENPKEPYRNVLYRIGLESNEDNLDLIAGLNEGAIDIEDVPEEIMNAFRKAGWEDDIIGNLNSTTESAKEDLVHTITEQLAEQDGIFASGYRYPYTQRLLTEDTRSALDDNNYFEIGVTHPGMSGQSYWHYPSATNAENGIIGHIRGTYIPAHATNATVRAPLVDNGRFGEATIPVRPNSVVIEEIQSDAQKRAPQTGALRQVHGTLFKAAINDALKRGADTIYLPSAATIAVPRGGVQNAGMFASIYDQQIVREGLRPLSQIPGVEINPVGVNGLLAYNEITFSPEAIETVLRGRGQRTPGYAQGGLVDLQGGATPANIARSVLGEGLAMGWGDEAEALVRSKLTDEDYADIIKRIRAQNEAYAEKHPIASLTGEIAGGVLPTIASFAALPFTGGASTPVAAANAGRMGLALAKLAPTAKAALIGGTQGAITGAGQAEEGDRAAGAVVGGGVGAGLGYGISKGAGMLIDAINRRAINRAASQVPDDSAYDALRQRYEDAGFIQRAVKDKGGNWFTGSIENAVAPLKTPTVAGETPAQRIPRHEALLQGPLAPGSRATVERILADTRRLAAVDRWVDTKLTKYIRNDMATPEDPVRALAEGEKGVLHYDPETHNPDYGITARRKLAGKPEAGLGESDLARRWERWSDSDIELSTWGLGKRTSAPHTKTGLKSTLAHNPWLENLPPGTNVYRMIDTSGLGFQHLVDELRNAIDPTSTMPAHLRLTPEKLDNVTMPQAVVLVNKINKYRTAEAIKAERAGMLENLANAPRLKDDALQLSFVEKPGGTWVDLAETTSEKGLKGCTSIGKAAGWCTQEPPKARSYGSGDSRLTTLLDADGRPHVQVQIHEIDVPDFSSRDYKKTLSSQTLARYRELVMQWRRRNPDVEELDDSQILQALKEAGEKGFGPDILEIKPPGNSFGSDQAQTYAKRDSQYRIKITDSVINFLNKGDWGKVQDLDQYNIIDLKNPRSTGRYIEDIYEDVDDRKLARFELTNALDKAPETPRFMTRGQFLKFLEPDEPQKFAEGGLVTYDPHAINQLAKQITQGFAQGGLVTYDLGAITALANKFKEDFHV